MSLTVAIIIIVACALALFAALGFVMSRPRRLRPHQPNRRRFAWWRGRTRGSRPDVSHR